MQILYKDISLVIDENTLAHSVSLITTQQKVLDDLISDLPHYCDQFTPSHAHAPFTIYGDPLMSVLHGVNKISNGFRVTRKYKFRQCHFKRL